VGLIVIVIQEKSGQIRAHIHTKIQTQETKKNTYQKKKEQNKQRQKLERVGGERKKEKGGGKKEGIKWESTELN